MSYTHIKTNELYFDILRKCVYKYKRTEEGKKAICKIMDDLIEKSNYNTAMNIAKNMLINGASLDFVSKCSNLPLEIVIQLQQ